MQCFTELTPPTAVTHSLSLPFLAADAHNLVVAKTSLLQIFSTKQVAVQLDSKDPGAQNTAENAIADRRLKDEDGLEAAFLGADSGSLRLDRASTTKLVLVAEYALSGTITSLVRVKTLNSKSGGEALLLAFKDAKLSLVEWDPERHGLSTISIHYYEQEDIRAGPWAPTLGDCVNYLVADPGSRCAALKFGARNLAILPFIQGDEDIAMDDWDEDVDGPRPVENDSAKPKEVNGTQDKPYASSFVLPMSTLDPALIRPIHLAFLYEYREPTFGILSSATMPSSSLLHERKDCLSYMVFTLDLDQKASTTILAVKGLPYDLTKVIALPSPIGGALLVGANELVYVDQAGKTGGVAVNSFAKQCTNFALSDQADLDMRLEGCQIQQLSIEHGEMLIILRTGSLAILSFKIDGRSVSGLHVRHVPQDAGGRVVPPSPSSSSLLSRNSMFIGSDICESLVLGWSKKWGQSAKKRIRSLDDAAVEDDMFPDEDGDIDIDDDDLYGDEAAPVEKHINGVNGTDSASQKGDYIFRVHDSLLNIAPMKDITFGRPTRTTEGEKSPDTEDIVSSLNLMGISGQDRSCALSILKTGVSPNTVGRFDFPEAQGVWALSVKKPSAVALQSNQSKTAMNGDYGAAAQVDRLMIVSKVGTAGEEESAVYGLTAANFEALKDTEFEPAAGSTIEAGTLGNGMRVIQVLKSEVRCYDGDLGLAQILPMADEETGAEPKIVSASIADPFLLLCRDDASLFVARCDESNDLEELEREDDTLLSTQWLTGCLYTDNNNVFATPIADKRRKFGENIMMFLLSTGGALYVYALPDLKKPVFIAEGLCFVPPVLSSAYAARRSTTRETLTELLVADLGDDVSKSPYLILRPASDDLTIYQPFRIPSSSSTPSPISSSLQFLKLHNPHLAKNPAVSSGEIAGNVQEKRDSPMRAIANVGGYSAVFLPGASPSFVLKSSKSTPKVLSLHGPGVRGLSSFHTEGCDRGFIYIDMKGIARVARLPPDTNFTEIGMSLKQVKFGETIDAVAYHPSEDLYVIATCTQEPFELPVGEDTHHRDWHREDISFKPIVDRGSLKLVSPQNWSIIDTIELEPYEAVTCLETLNLEVSEASHERKLLFAVGTAVTRGEDLAVKGNVRVFEIINVIPYPNRPETNRKLKLLAREEIPRGAVTKVSEIGGQGFMVVAQGQKLMVRGLKEDGTLLPVAFLDVNCYVTALKELRGTGICLVGDALKGTWLAGYTEEPYKMMLFGKAPGKMEVVVAELLPDGKDLFIVVADADCNLHVLQYDPEHPKSLQGHLLLHRTTFALGGHLPTTMTLLPRTKAPTLLAATAENANLAAEATIPEHEILITSLTGSISVLSPLSEAQYRRVSTLSSHLSNMLYHPCGLNPKAYRQARDAPEGMLGGRQVVDGSLVGRWMELGTQRRLEVAGRVGVGMQEVRDDLEGLVSGLGYL